MASPFTPIITLAWIVWVRQQNGSSDSFLMLQQLSRIENIWLFEVVGPDIHTLLGVFTKLWHLNTPQNRNYTNNNYSGN